LEQDSTNVAAARFELEKLVRYPKHVEEPTLYGNAQKVDELLQLANLHARPARILWHGPSNAWSHVVSKFFARTGTERLNQHAIAEGFHVYSHMFCVVLLGLTLFVILIEACHSVVERSCDSYGR
jgi:hypothetical protein